MICLESVGSNDLNGIKRVMIWMQSKGGMHSMESKGVNDSDGIKRA